MDNIDQIAKNVLERRIGKNYIYKHFFNCVKTKYGETYPYCGNWIYVTNNCFYISKYISSGCDDIDLYVISKLGKRYDL